MTARPTALVATLESTSPLTYSAIEIGRREDVQEVARPDVLEERHGHALHDAGEEVPQQHRAEQRRDEVEARRAATPFEPRA